jgi:hypothetical protein
MYWLAIPFALLQISVLVCFVFFLGICLHDLASNTE